VSYNDAEVLVFGISAHDPPFTHTAALIGTMLITTVWPGDADLFTAKIAAVAVNPVIRDRKRSKDRMDKKVDAATGDEKFNPALLTYPEKILKTVSNTGLLQSKIGNFFFHTRRIQSKQLTDAFLD